MKELIENIISYEKEGQNIVEKARREQKEKVEDAKSRFEKEEMVEINKFHESLLSIAKKAQQEADSKRKSILDSAKNEMEELKKKIFHSEINKHTELSINILLGKNA